MPHRLCSLFALLLTVVGVACQPPPSYDATRRRCGLRPDEVAVGTWAAAGGDGPISAACADALAGDFGLDWDSFGEVPHTFSQPTTPAEGLIAALYVGLAADFGSLQDLLDAPGNSPDLTADLAAIAADLGLQGSDPAGPALYVHVALGVHRIQFSPDLDVEARIDHGVVQWGSDAWMQRVDAIGGWALLANEVAHRVQHGHGPCADDPSLFACDASSEGPLGHEALVATLYQDALVEKDGDRAEACTAARWTRINACGRILDPGHARACQIPPLEACYDTELR